MQINALTLVIAIAAAIAAHVAGITLTVFAGIRVPPLKIFIAVAAGASFAFIFKPEWIFATGALVGNQRLDVLVGRFCLRTAKTILNSSSFMFII